MENKKYKYIGECNGNNNDGCFMDSCGHDCGCFKRVEITDNLEIREGDSVLNIDGDISSGLARMSLEIEYTNLYSMIYLNESKLIKLKEHIDKLLTQSDAK